MIRHLVLFFFFFFNDTATTEIYTLSLHDALPISLRGRETALTVRAEHGQQRHPQSVAVGKHRHRVGGWRRRKRSEEHTSELQSRLHLVCRLLLEKKKKNKVTSEQRSTI